MNEITIRGYLRNIEFSHQQGDIEFDKAVIVCPRSGTQEDDLINIVFKKYVNNYTDGDFVEITGNVRTFSNRVNNKNSVNVYVNTYFDHPEEIYSNKVVIDGRICKIEPLSTTKNGKKYLHFILANNIFTQNGKKINSYIPCTCYNSIAEELSNYKVNDFIEVTGQLNSHMYKKDSEYRVAHEVIIETFNGELNV